MWVSRVGILRPRFDTAGTVITGNRCLAEKKKSKEAQGAGSWRSGKGTTTQFRAPGFDSRRSLLYFHTKYSTSGIEARTKDTNPSYPLLPKNYLSFTFLTTAHHSPSLSPPSPPSHCPVKPLGNLQTSVRLSDCSRNLRASSFCSAKTSHSTGSVLLLRQSNSGQLPHNS